MSIPSAFQTGRTGMMTAKAAISTTGHNIANANTEGFSRQRVLVSAETPRGGTVGHGVIGQGTRVSRVERINDEYLDKHVRTATRDMANLEEKDMALRQTEDIFNEMNGDGLNRLVSKFFNEFRKLSNEPDNEAIRQSVRESSQALVNDFHRLREEVEGVRRHLDSRLEGYASEVNGLAQQLKGYNMQIQRVEAEGALPNDLLDQRDNVLKKLGTYFDIATHKDNFGSYVVDVRGVGPLVVGPEAESFSVFRTKSDGTGKPEGAMEIASSSNANSIVTHQIKGGKMGALLEVRDQTLSTVLSKLDELAFNLSQSVNEIHSQGFTRQGLQGINFFGALNGKDRASEFIGLSDEVSNNVHNIAAAAEVNAPGDNRIALAISGLQNIKLMADGSASMDDYYNSIVSDLGVASARNKSGLTQQKDIMTQLNKMRDQLSGVSIDEETANLMQFQHSFDASAKVIQVADEMMKTIMELKR